jgi:hypothetical protein
MPVKFQFFVQDHSGEHNLERDCASRAVADLHFRRVRDGGGYWTEGRDGEEVFVPWHRVDFIRITEIKDGE